MSQPYRIHTGVSRLFFRLATGRRAFETPARRKPSKVCWTQKLLAQSKRTNYLIRLTTPSPMPGSLCFIGLWPSQGPMPK